MEPSPPDLDELLADPADLLVESCVEALVGDFVPEVLDSGFVSEAFTLGLVALVSVVLVSGVALSGLTESEALESDVLESETLESDVLEAEVDGPDCPDVDCETGPRTMP